MKILVAGANGQIARALIERGSQSGITIVARGRKDFNLEDETLITKIVSELSPDIIINTAAYTAVDQAESDEAAANALNNDSARNIAKAAAARQIPIIHFSTDYVFNGQSDRPWRESDAPVPLSAYGRSKLAGERAVAAENPRHIIIRTAWVYSPFGKNFVKAMLRAAEWHDALDVVADQHGTPTSALDIADGVLTIAKHVFEQPRKADYGIFHMTGGGATVWAEFAEAIFAASAPLGGPSAYVNNIPTSQYPTVAARPGYSLLDCSKVKSTYGVALPDWRISVQQCVQRLIGDNSWRE